MRPESLYMRITRGDNWANLFLPALTFLGIVGTFVGGNLYEFMRAEKEIIIHSSTNPQRVIIYCDEQKFEVNKLRENVWQLLTKDCDGTIHLYINGNSIGKCPKEFDDFSRIEIRADAKNFTGDDCSYFKDDIQKSVTIKHD